MKSMTVTRFYLAQRDTHRKVSLVKLSAIITGVKFAEAAKQHLVQKNNNE
jgi:cytochrome b subunit of formate dehydrogenase